MGTLLCHLPVNIPNPVIEIKMRMIPTTISFLLIGFLEKIFFTSKVFATGHASTQLKHEVHSSERTVNTLSTFIKEGHAFAQSSQSIQLVGVLLIFVGLKKAIKPSKAPYGHKYLHQKFLINIESANRTEITINAKRDMLAKKCHIFISDIILYGPLKK